MTRKRPGYTPCIALTVSGPCAEPAVMLRLCARHSARQGQLIRLGKTLTFTVMNFDIGLEKVIEA
jgi:hypothetical protein